MACNSLYHMKIVRHRPPAAAYDCGFATSLSFFGLFQAENIRVFSKKNYSNGHGYRLYLFTGSYVGKFQSFEKYFFKLIKRTFIIVGIIFAIK
jgi:hypothetical protein